MFNVGDKVKCIRVEGTRLELGCVETVKQVGPDWLELKGIGGVYFMDRFELVPRPHKHAELIKAWADNPKLKFEYSHDGGDHWMVIVNPTWIPEYKYRIKPEPKPDVVLYGCENNPFAQGQLQDDGSIIMRSIMTSRRVDADQAKFTFDGETGKLKAVEILSK